MIVHPSVRYGKGGVYASPSSGDFHPIFRRKAELFKNYLVPFHVNAHSVTLPFLSVINLSIRELNVKKKPDAITSGPGLQQSSLGKARVTVLFSDDNVIVKRYTENLPRLHELLCHCYVFARWLRVT